MSRSEPASHPDRTPPWLADGEPVDRSDLVEVTAPSRRYPKPIVDTQGWTEHPLWFGPGGVEIDEAETAPHLRHLAEAGLAAHDSSKLTRDQAIGILVISGDRVIAGNVVLGIAEKFGVVETTRMLIESYQCGVRFTYNLNGPSRVAVIADPTPIRGRDQLPFGSNESSLRVLLAAAGEQDYDAAAAVIREAWPNLPPVRQAGLAMALPDQPELTEELITTHAAAKPAFLHWLQATAPTAELAAIAASVTSGGFGKVRHLVNAVLVNRGVDAVGYLARYVDDDPCSEALTRIGTPEAIRALTGAALGGKAALARLQSAVDRWPVAAAAGLAETAAGEGRAGTLAQSTLAELIATRPELAELVMRWVSPSAAAILSQLANKATQVLDEADVAQLPGVLRNPPWLRQRAKDVTIDLDPLPLEPTETWPDGRRTKARPWTGGRPTLNTLEKVTDHICRSDPRADQAALQPHRDAFLAALTAGDADEAAAAFRTWSTTKRDTLRWAPSVMISAYDLLSVAAEVLDGVRPGFSLDLWNALAGAGEFDSEVDYAISVYGLAALPGLMKVIQRRVDDIGLAEPFGAIELAPMMARAFHKLKSVSERGLGWLLAHPEHAAAGLIAPALGAAGEARDCARAALQRLGKADQGRTLILAVAELYQRDDVLAAVEQLLTESPNDRFPTKLPKLPKWWTPAMWTRPLLTSGHALPLAAVDQLGMMLMFPPVDDQPYPGIAEVVAACDRDSLAEFGWDLFAAWLAAGGVAKEGWALTCLGAFGTDTTARRLTPYLRAWPGESQHKRAVTGLAVLEGIGTDLAMMQLNGIATKIKFRALQDAARDKIDAIAERRGLSTEELEDRLAPDLGLAEDGTTNLNFGPRSFTVGFDEALRPYVRDESGARLKDLPKPRQTDDAGQSAEATARWKALKKDAKTVAAQQVLRLELAMCAQRRWDLDTFTTFLARHPLVRHLVQRLLWASYDADNTPVTFFRVDEAATPTNADDEPLTLPDDAILGIPHPVEIPAGVAASFGQLLADYELLQPFDQLARESNRLSAADLASTRLTRWAGRQVPTGKVLGLTNRGWRRGVPADAGLVTYVEKELGDRQSLVVTLVPGLFTGYLDEAPEQEVTGVSYGVANWGEVVDPQPFSALNPIVVSELLRDLNGLHG